MAQGTITIDGSQAAKQIADAFTEGIARLEAAAKGLGIEALTVSLDVKGSPKWEYGGLKQGIPLGTLKKPDLTVTHEEIRDDGGTLVGHKVLSVEPAAPLFLRGEGAQVDALTRRDVDTNAVPGAAILSNMPIPDCGYYAPELCNQNQIVRFGAHLREPVGGFYQFGNEDPQGEGVLTAGANTPAQASSKAESFVKYGDILRRGGISGAFTVGDTSNDASTATPLEREAAALEGEFKRQAEAMGFKGSVYCDPKLEPDRVFAGAPDVARVRAFLSIKGHDDRHAIDVSVDATGLKSTKAIARILDAVANCEREIVAARSEAD